MNSISCGRGLLIFSLTFLAGIFFTLVIEYNERIMAVRPALIQNEFIKSANLHRTEKNGKDSKLHQLLRERIDLEVELRRAKTFPEDDIKIKIHSAKLGEINQQIKKIQKELLEGKYQIESEAARNLLYVEKCIEY